MLPHRHPDRIRIAFGDHRLVANAGLIIPATLALRLGLPQLLRKHLDLGDAPFTIDLDSTICEICGLAKEGARHHGYTGKRGYHPLLAIAAGTGRRADGPAARGPRQHRPGRRPLPLRETGGAGSLRRGPGATHGAGRQRLLHS